MSTESVVLMGVAVYIAIMLAVGIYASKKTHSAAEFAVAGRRLGVWFLATTIIATWFGGGMMMGGSGAAYDDGMLGIIADPFGASVCLFLVAMFFARLMRRLKFFTFVEFVEQRFGPTCGLIASFASVFGTIMWTGGMLVAFALIFELLTGVSMLYGIVGGAVVVILYTAIGGMLAVALTDFIQMMIIIVGLVVLLVVVLIDAGGWSTVSARLPDDTWRMIPIAKTPEVWLNYLRAWFIYGLADISSQSLMQRAMAAKSERAAQNAFYVAGFGYLALGMIPAFLGIIASVTMPGLENSEQVLPALAIELLHPVFIAVFVGALLAAIMSSCDSTLLAGATVLSTNVLPYLRKNPTDHQRLIASRWGIIVCGSISVIVAIRTMEVFDTALDANLLTLAAIIVPFILGVWWKKANRSGALSAMVVGIIVWLVSEFVYPGLPGDLLGLGASLVTMVVVTLATQKVDPPRGLFDHDGNKVELRDRLGVLGIGN